jgi:hypothetical protein
MPEDYATAVRHNRDMPEDGGWDDDSSDRNLHYEGMSSKVYDFRKSPQRMSTKRKVILFGVATGISCVLGGLAYYFSR